MNDKRIPIKLGEKTYHLLFSLNVIEKLSERYPEKEYETPDGTVTVGGVEAMEYELGAKGLKGIGEVKWLIAELISEDIRCQNFLNHTNEPEISPEIVGFMIAGTDEIYSAINAIRRSLYGSFPENKAEIKNEETTTAKT